MFQSKLAACIHLYRPPAKISMIFEKVMEMLQNNDHMQPEGTINTAISPPPTTMESFQQFPYTLFISFLPPGFSSSRSPAGLTCIPWVFIHICRIALILKEER